MSARLLLLERFGYVTDRLLLVAVTIGTTPFNFELVEAVCGCDGEGVGLMEVGLSLGLSLGLGLGLGSSGFWIPSTALIPMAMLIGRGLPPEASLHSFEWQNPVNILKLFKLTSRWY